MSLIDHQRLVRRLDRVLAVLERPGTEGEADAARNAAASLLAANPGFWRDRLGEVIATRQPVRVSRGWRAIALDCCVRALELSTWERDFVADVLRQRSLSPKQVAKLRQIADRIGIDVVGQP